MKTQQTGHDKSYTRRQMRFAEAGVLFLIILGLTIFGGVKLASHGGAETEPRVAEAPIEPVTEPVENPAPVLEAADTVAPDPESEAGEPEAAPQPRVVSYALAEAAFFEGRFAEAADLFTAYADEHPDNAWGHYMQGLSLWRDERPEAAGDAFTAALELQPEHLKSLVNLGRVLLDMDRAEEALPLLEKAVALDADYGDAYRVLGRVYHRMQRRDDAITAYRGALEKDLQDAWSLNNLGLLYIESERCEEALAPLALAVSLRQDVACFHNNLGIALERTGHATQAAEAYAGALATDAGYAKAEISLARVESVTPTDEIDRIDLAGLAAGFQVEPVPPVQIGVDESTVVAVTPTVEEEIH